MPVGRAFRPSPFRLPSGPSLPFLLLALRLLCAPGAPLRAAGDAPAPPSPLTVEALDADSWAAAAGLEAGDEIAAATLEAEAGLALERRQVPLRYPFEIEALFIEETPRRAVVLHGSRGGAPREWSLPRGASLAGAGLLVRPALPPPLLDLYREARKRLGEGRLADAAGPWLEAARRSAGEPHVAAWLLSTLARAYADAGKWEEAAPHYLASTEILSTPSPDLSQRLQDWGTRLSELSRWPEATEKLERALAVDRALAPRSLSAGWTLTALGNVKSASDPAAAVELFRQALELRTALAPGSSDVANSLIDLGVEAGRAGDLEEADRRFRAALAIEERLRPESLAVARLVNNLGVVSGMRGDLEQEETFYRRALRLKEKLKASGTQLASTLNNLGVTAKARGRLAAAEDYYRRALALHRAEAAESLLVAQDYSNLGLLALQRFDVEGAEDLFRSSAAILEKTAPDSPELAETMARLGITAHERGDLGRARELAGQAYRLYSNLPPEDSRRGLAALEMASLEREAGNLDRAAELARGVAEPGGRPEPETLVAMQGWHELALIAAARGDRRGAEEGYGRAIAIQARLAPDHRDHALLLHELGRLESRFGGEASGLPHLCEAVEVVERGRGLAGGSDTQKLLTEARLGPFYHDCAAALVGARRGAEAFALLERGRARIFLQQLEERDLVFSRDLSPELDSRRRRLDRRYEAKEEAIARLDLSKDGAAFEVASGELRALAREREELQRQIRSVASPLGTLQAESAAPSGPAGDRSGAIAPPDPGTVLLSFSVGDEATLLFALVAGPRAEPRLGAFRLPAGGAALRGKVARFRALLEDPDSPVAASRELGAELYRLLLAPAERLLGRAERIVVVGDGPLLSLPFSTLVRREKGGRGERYLAEWKPLHSVLSAAVYARLRTSRPGPAAARSGLLAAFGDPVYGGVAIGEGAAGAGETRSGEIREALRLGRLAPLPGSRRELQSISALFPGARVFAGPEASEENVKAVARGSRRLHLAVHGLLNERSPLDSALALSLPGNRAEEGENGLLHAWEILEEVRLDADLVTLSACSSGLGQEMGGEGLIGLTRAFQYAGARSVLASLWNVSDDSTAELMERFYAQLARGIPKDEALRRAQVELLGEKGGRWAHPYHWAAFELAGDWR